MSDYAKSQLATALRTLPWYIAIPALPALVLSLFLGLFSTPAGVRFVEFMAGLGFFVWCMRQVIRLFWTVRVETR